MGVVSCEAAEGVEEEEGEAEEGGGTSDEGNDADREVRPVTEALKETKEGEQT